MQMIRTSRPVTGRALSARIRRRTSPLGIGSRDANGLLGPRVSETLAIIERLFDAGIMKTKSEEVFESFLTLNNLPFEKIEEILEKGEHRPDYLVQPGDCKLIFEVKELAEDENYGVVSDPRYPHIRLSSRTVGDHVRRTIERSRKQIQYGAKQGISSILLIYNSLDPAFQNFGTEDHDFTSAMYGQSTVLIDKHTRQTSELFSGLNSSLHERKNTSFSAVGRLTDRCQKINDEVVRELKVTLFENAFAEVKLPFDQIPPCIEVKRVEISREPLSFT